MIEKRRAWVLQLPRRARKYRSDRTVSYTRDAGMDVRVAPTEPQGALLKMGTNSQARGDMDTAGPNSSPLSDSTPLRQIPEVGAG